MSNIPDSFLAPSSQPWGRWVTSSLREFFRKRDEYDKATFNAIKQLNIAIPQPMRGLLTRQIQFTLDITTAGVYVPINTAGTLDADVSFNMIASSSPNVTGVVNDTNQSRIVVIIATYDGKAGNNHSLGCKLALNNQLIDASECRSFGGATGQVAKVMTHYILRLEPGDNVSMYAANIDTIDDIIIDRFKMMAYAIP